MLCPPLWVPSAGAAEPCHPSPSPALLAESGASPGGFARAALRGLSPPGCCWVLQVPPHSTHQQLLQPAGGLGHAGGDGEQRGTGHRVIPAPWQGLGGATGTCSGALPIPLCHQGLESSWERHRANCTLLCQGLRELGLELFVKEEVGAGSPSRRAARRWAARSVPRGGWMLERSPRPPCWALPSQGSPGLSPVALSTRQRGCPPSPPSGCPRATPGRRSRPF